MNTPKQDEAVEFVARNPGCSKIDVARRVGPNGSLQYGYRTVDRAIASGKILAVMGRGKYSLAVA